MKKYHIFTLLTIISTIAFFATPQLSDGRIFINNMEEEKPTDWLSALIKRYFYSESTKEPFEIPKNIKTIVFQGKKGEITSANLSEIYLINDPSKPNQVITNVYDSKFKNSTKNDTLIIEVNEANLYLQVNIDSTIQSIVFDNVKKTKISNNQPYPIAFNLTNRSDITITGNQNRKLNKFNVKEQSTLSLNHIFTPKVDVEIDNSMVYIDPQNNIDSLQAHLIGKSNIQIKNTLKEWEKGDQSDKLKQELNIKETHINVFPTGNLEYYNKSK